MPPRTSNSTESIRLPYPTLPLTDNEPTGTQTPDPQTGETFIGCSVCPDWDVSYLSSDGRLYNNSPLPDADATDLNAGYTTCNHCGRVYPNTHRDGGPLPTVARINTTSDEWLDALDLYQHRTFATDLVRQANIHRCIAQA